MTKEQIQQAKDGAKLMLEMAESAEECDYLRKNAVSVRQVHNRQLTDLEDRLRDAQNVIKTQERELETQEKELSRHRETGATLTNLIDGQPIEYWASVAKSAAQRNDELLTALREKEKIAAEFETHCRKWEADYAELANQNDQNFKDALHHSQEAEKAKDKLQAIKNTLHIISGK